MKRFSICLVLILTAIVCSVVVVHAQAKYVAVVVIDGMRPDYMDIAATPNLKKLMSAGTYYDEAWVGGVVNNTPPSHATISTGCFTRTHGIVAFTWKDPTTGEEYNPTKLKPVENGALAKMVSDRHLPSLARLVKERYPDARTAAVGAHKFHAVGSLAADSSDCTVFSGGRRSNVELGLEGSPDDVGDGDFVVGQRPSNEILKDVRALTSKGDAWGMDSAIVVLKHLKPRVLLINLPSVDGVGHSCGGIRSPEVMKPVVEEADRQVGKLLEAYKALGIYEETLFIVTADHGMMAAQPPVEHKLLQEALDKFGTKVVTSTDTGPVWISDSSKAKDVVEYVMAKRPAAASAGYYKVKEGGKYRYKASPATLKSLGPKLAKTYKYLLSTIACANGPDIFFCSREMSPIPADFPKRGRHYQIAWGAQHIPLVLAGPGVKQGFVSKSPARLVDIAPTALALMGVKPKGMDGIALADALLNPTEKQQSAQNRVNKKLASARDTLRAQPTYDPGAVSGEQ
ncbi:MAG: alkaline phosphatase family protein [Armatimonadota bacterium]|nr:alkaline phosphatase family protein [Armatimonadota bacterium]